MTGPNSNITSQQPATKNPSIIDIYDASQMPLALAPDGVMRFRPELATKYILHPGVILPRLEIQPFSNPASPEGIEFTTAIQGQFIPVAGNSTPHIWGRDINGLVFVDISLVDVSPQTTRLFDLVGGTSFSNLSLTRVLLFNFKEVGNVIDLSLVMNSVTLLDNERGMVSKDNTLPFVSSFISGRIVDFLGVSTQSPALCYLGLQGTVSISINNIEIKAGDSAICIDSGASGSYDVIGNSFNGVGDFFMSDISESITAFADVSITIDSFSDSVDNPGTRTDLNFSSPIDDEIRRGQTILISDEAAYDGLHVVTKVYDDQLSVEIDVVFSTSGAGVLERTLVTSADHGLVLDQTIVITVTTSYNGTFNISTLTSNDDFVIPAAFIADDATGTVTATGGDETTPGVTSALNGDAADSRAIGFGEMNGNAVATVIAAPDVYQAVDVSTVVSNSVSERFTLTDATDGIYRYDGEKPIIARIVGLVTGFKSGSTESYRFTASLNGAIPVFATAPYAPLEIKTTKSASTVLKAVTLVKNDTLQVMVAGDGTSDNLTISDFLIEIEGS